MFLPTFVVWRSDPFYWHKHAILHYEYSEFHPCAWHKLACSTTPWIYCISPKFHSWLWHKHAIMEWILYTFTQDVVFMHLFPDLPQILSHPPCMAARYNLRGGHCSCSTEPPTIVVNFVVIVYVCCHCFWRLLFVIVFDVCCLLSLLYAVAFYYTVSNRNKLVCCCYSVTW